MKVCIVLLFCSLFFYYSSAQSFQNITLNKGNLDSLKRNPRMNNFIAQPMEGGYSWTLTTFALKFLEDAETLFGKRAQNFIYAGIELTTNSHPQVWYPLNKYVVIQLPEATAFDWKKAIFELSHEVIHVLSPSGKAKVTNLEEGLGAYFSTLITDRYTKDVNYAISSLRQSKYYYPYQLVAQLLQIRHDAIVELRKMQPVLDKVTKEDFKKAKLDIPQDLISELLKPMQY
jgi:hypothetical protein